MFSTIGCRCEVVVNLASDKLTTDETSILKFPGTNFQVNRDFLGLDHLSTHTLFFFYTLMQNINSSCRCVCVCVCACF
jgi:hypothetical protein